VVWSPVGDPHVRELGIRLVELLGRGSGLLLEREQLPLHAIQLDSVSRRALVELLDLVAERLETCALLAIRFGQFLRLGVQPPNALVELGGGVVRPALRDLGAVRSIEVLSKCQGGHAPERNDLADRAAAERALLLAHDHEQRDQVFLIREWHADARLPVRDRRQRMERRRFGRVRLVARRRLEEVGQQRAAVADVEKCTGVKELSHESRRQLVDPEVQLAVRETAAFALVQVDEAVATDFVERERRAPIGADGLQIAEKLEHDGFGVP
jgi:hypothetical protein